jgi:hypothetical protein
MTENNFILGPGSSPDTDQLTKALAAAQAVYTHVPLDSANPHFKSRFSSYAECCDSLRGPLTKNGLALPDFRPGLVGSQWVLVGTLRHISGQFITGICPLVNPKGDMQGFGAACTYAKRTLLMALVGGFSGEADDDGQAVQAESRKVEAKPASVTPAEKATRSMEIEARATLAIAEAKSKKDAQKVLDTVKLRISQGVCNDGVLQRLQNTFGEKFQLQEVSNG